MKLRGILFLAMLAQLPLHAEGQLQVVSETGSRQHRVNMVFLAEGYTISELPQFAEDVQSAVDSLFSREPWTRYRSYINVYRIDVASDESGTDNGSAGDLFETAFNSGFVTPGVAQLCTINTIGQQHVYDLLEIHVPEYDIPIVLVNDTKYGGSGGAIAISTTHPFSAQIIEHELGHSFAGLGDEYDYDYPGYEPYETPNTTSISVVAELSWASWIADSTPVPTPETAIYDAVVGLFEGAAYRATGWFRPHLDSMMRSLGSPVGQVNRQQFVIALYERINLFDEVSPPPLKRPITGFEPLAFEIIPKQPATGSDLTIEWTMDGTTIASGPSLTLTSDDLGNGSHHVIATLRDPTPWVRVDPDQLLHATLRWDFELSGQLPPTLPAWRTAYGPDLANPSGDGIPNLLKYALGLDPAVPALGTDLPQAEWIEEQGAFHLALSIPRRTERTDVSYVVEVSDDLGSWKSGTAHTAVIENRDNLLQVRIVKPRTASTRQFLRLKIVPN